MSKDGDWIIRETPEDIEYVLKVLESHNARYRFGAPLDVRWLQGGWSSHFEFLESALRVRTDFISRPPRIRPERLKEIWQEQQSRKFPFVDLIDLIELKKTNREKDYAVIGEIARKIPDTDNRLRYSRSAREIHDLCKKFPELASRIATERPQVIRAAADIDHLETALDAERRQMIHENEKRLLTYMTAASKWAESWKTVEQEISGLPLMDAHKIMVEKAKDLLPFGPGGEYDGFTQR